MRSPIEKAMTTVLPWASNERGRSIVVFATLSLLAYLGNYLLAPDFGLYEDDYFFTLPGFGWSWVEAWAHIKNAWITWPQGRPLGFSLTHLLGYLSGRFDSLMPGYIVGWMLHALNGCLIFSLLRHWTSVPVALMSAAVFLLYPADGSRIILMLRIFQLLNLTFVLAALLLYIRGHLVWSYVVAALCFIVYEHFYLPFLIAPLLVRRFRDLQPKRIVLHGLLFPAIPATFLWLRRALGESRAADVLAAPEQVLTKILSAATIGTRTAAEALVSRPLDSILHSDTSQWLLIVASATAVFWVSISCRTPCKVASTGERPLDSKLESSLLLFAVGTVGFTFSYVLAFRSDNYPPVMNLGRISGFHAPGSIGVSLALAGLGTAAAVLSEKVKTYLLALGSIYAGSLVSWGIEIQRVDYLEHWRQQRSYWSTILSSSGEWQAGVPVIVDIDGQDNPRLSTPGFPYYWLVNYPPLGAQAFLSASAWSNLSSSNEPGILPTRVYGYSSFMETSITENGVRLETPGWLPPAQRPVIRNGEFILFKMKERRIVRSDDPWMISAGTFHPKPRPTPAPPEQSYSRVHEILLSDPADWPSVRRAKNYPR